MKSYGKSRIRLAQNLEAWHGIITKNLLKLEIDALIFFFL